ncbi:MAG: hypothetical protein KBG07_01600 [Elusimicrobia bacterium]|nr:hypothetical protein [Elusimicrobiota bacterium]
MERHRNLLPGAGQAQLVDHLLKKGFLNGPESYGLTTEKMPDFWGVEDAALYDANVQAYRDTLAIEVESQAALQTLKKETSQRQTRLFSTPLQNLDREVQARHEDRGDLAKYVKVVWDEAGASGQGSQVRRFMEAKSKEDRLSFSDVEQARAAFIERVSPRLSPFELNSLVRETTAFRAGSLSAKDYYKELVSLALAKGVPVSAYPAFQSYIEYVSVADGIDVVALMDEMEVLEERAYARLAVGDCAPLVEWTKDLRLAERALQRAMTPREWALFEMRRGELSRLVERAVTLGIPREPAEVLQSNLPRFAAFFEAATARNNTLLENALTHARQRGATTVVLVTGGFHGPALEKRLADKNISHVVLTPRIDAVPNSAAGYLGAFAPTRTPLEKLLLGDRLFMNPPSATAVAVADQNHSFHPAAKALANGEIVYGSALAAASGKLESFVDLWNERFGRLGRAVVHRVKGILEIRFFNSRTLLLLDTGGAGAGITERGGKVVEEGQVGDVRYALGGRNITSIIPELITAVGFVVLYWGSALSPPVFAMGLLAGIVFGGISVRGIILGSLHLHEMGHALLLQWLGGPSVRESYARYSEKISLKQIIPFSDIFIPLLSPAATAPQIKVENLTEGWKTRVTALVGPLVNLGAIAMVAPLALVADAGSVQSLLLTVAGGVNLWVAMASVSDFRMALSGIGDALYCGNLGVLGKRWPTDRGILPINVDAILARMWKQIIVRGGQSGGRSILGTKGFVRARLLNPKRAKMDQALRTSFRGEIGRRRATGARPLDNFVEEIDHARFATGGPSKMGNAHPFVWGLVEGFWNAVFPRKARVWTVGEGGKTEIVRKVSQQIISHNGDFDAWVRRKGEAPIANNGPLAWWLTKTLGRGDPSQGDSPKIAGMLELLLTQGQWGASFRLAYAVDVADSIDDVMSPSNVREIGRSVDKVFEEWLKRAHVAGCRTLQDVYNENSSSINDLRDQVLNATRLDTLGMSHEKKELLVDRALHYFFFNDLQEAGRFFSDRADGTFGVVLASSLYPGEIVFGSFKQPLYIGVDPETEMLVYASELASVKAAGTPGNDQITELLPYIYFLENGEVAHFKIGEGDIPNSVAFPNGFELLGSAPLPDLGGTELVGRHPLTAENLERWASQSMEEGGRGWVGTKGNKNLSGGVSVAQSSDLVLDTLNDVPKVLATINADWGGENPGSPNLGAAEDFAGAVLERARVRALTRYPGDPAFKNQIDVLVLGAEYGLFAADHFTTDLKKVFPGLKVEAVDSKAFSDDPEEFAVGPNTIVLAVSHSGQYFHTVDDVSFLNALHEQGRCGPVFGMAGLVDSVPLGQALGQSYKASAKSNRRLFVTHAGWRLDEPKPVVPLATEMTLSHLLITIAEKAKHKKFGRAPDDDTIRRLKQGQAHLQERAESIFGINRKGQKVDAREHKELVAVGHRYSQRLTEFLIATPLALGHLFLVLFIGGNPIQGGFDVLFSLSLNGPCFRMRPPWGILLLRIGRFLTLPWPISSRRFWFGWFSGGLCGGVMSQLPLFSWATLVSFISPYGPTSANCFR